MRTLGAIKKKGARKERYVRWTSELPKVCPECKGKMHFATYHPHQEGEPCCICVKCDIAYLVNPW